jgi:hypothetical protein
MRVNEVTDVCFIRHIFTCFGYSQFFILKVRRHQVGFCSAFAGSILAHSLIYVSPLCRLLIRVSDPDTCSVVILHIAFERAFDSRW